MHPSSAYKIPPALGPVVPKRSPSTAARSVTVSSPSGITPSRPRPHYEGHDVSPAVLSPTASTRVRLGARAPSASRSDLRFPSSPTGHHSPSPDIVARPALQFKSGCGVLVHEWRKGECVATFKCGDLLGQGGFAKVFDFIDVRSQERFACKIVDKEKLKSESTRTKFFAEVDIHQRLKHPNILNFVRYFDDDHYYYLLLERCCRYSLMDLHMSRGVFTVPEIQHIMTQLLIATDFLHSNLVIHRDLKLGNLMIDPAGNIKVGDFGFATQLDSPDQLKVTMCGTPNYIAPEVLKPEDATRSPTGYSFGADIWSLGVILYTLAVGKPPFETKDVQATYNLIRKCEYRFPDGSLTTPSVPIPTGVRSMVSEMLLLRPQDRSPIIKLRCHPFLSSTPSMAPLSLTDLDAEISPHSRSPTSQGDVKHALGPLRGGGIARSSSLSPHGRPPHPSHFETVGRSQPTSSKNQCPARVFLPCGVSIVEYAHFPKYGWCYRMLQADGRVMTGVTLNDCTKVLGDDATSHIWYYNRERTADRHMDKMFFFQSAAEALSFAETSKGADMSLQKKVSILNFLKNHMGPARDAVGESQIQSTASSYYAPITRQTNAALTLASPSPPVIVKQFQQHTAFNCAPSTVRMSAVTMRLSNGNYQHVIHVFACDVAECVFVSGYGPCVSPWIIDFSRPISREVDAFHIIFSSQLNRQCFPVSVSPAALMESSQGGGFLDTGVLRIPSWLCSQMMALSR